MYTLELLNTLIKNQEQSISAYREKKLKDFASLSTPHWTRMGLHDFTIPPFKPFTKTYLQVEDQEKDCYVKDIFSGLEDNAALRSVLEVDESYGIDKKYVVLGEAFYNTGVAVHARKDSTSKPIYVNYALDKDNPMVIDHNIIIAEEGSEVTVVMDYYTEDESQVFHNGVTKVFVSDNAVVNVIKIQRFNPKSYNFDSNIANVQSKGQINWTTVELGGEAVVSSFSSNLKGHSSKGVLKSIYYGDGKSKMDLMYQMKHFGLTTDSLIDCRGALKDYAKKVFRGNLMFERGSTGSVGCEKESVTLLDPTVESDAIPILFCGEDDVEGEHAASAGQISENLLVYLMSRGLRKKDAKKLLVEASFKLIIDKIPLEDVRTKITGHVLRRLEDDEL